MPAYLGVFSRESVKALLNDMIAVEILDQFHNVTTQSANHCLDLGIVSLGKHFGHSYLGTYLLRSREKFDHFLQSTRTMLVEGDLDKLRGCIVDKNCTLLVVGKFEKLLTKIVAKWVSHKIYDLMICLDENHVNILREVFLKLPLQVTASMLIGAQAKQLSLEVL